MAPRINDLVAAALLELDSRTAPSSGERPTPVIKAAVDGLLGHEPAEVAPAPPGVDQPAG
jgi:hypothetical protein